jgi:hypothetical protein
LVARTIMTKRPHVILIVARTDSQVNAARETRQIREALSGCGDFEIHAPDAIEPGELVSHIRKLNPTILHVISHGAIRGHVASVTLSDSEGLKKDLRLDHVRDYVCHRIESEGAPKLSCVFLNACYVGAWARELLDCVDVVVGTDIAVLDTTARYFATKFYEHLGMGIGVERAFHDAASATRMEQHAGADHFLMVQAQHEISSESRALISPIQLDAEDPHELVDLRARRSLVLYVGPELSSLAGLPSRRELAQLLLDQLPDGFPADSRAELRELVGRPDLTDAFSALERTFTRARFGTIVERALDDLRLEPPELAHALAGLGDRVRGVLTPNLDRLLERAFQGRLAVYTEPNISLGRRSNWLFKTHGELGEPNTWAFTREQQGRVIHDRQHEAIFQALFIGANILFVGVDLEDPILAPTLDQIRVLADGNLPEHWALLPRDRLGFESRSKLAEIGVQVIPYDSAEHRLAILRSLARETL